MDTKGISRSSFLVQAGTFLIGLFGVSTSVKAAPTTPPEASGSPLYMQDFTAFRGKTLEQKIEEIADREEIRELIARYAHRVARGASNADLFTEDGVFIEQAPGRPVEETRTRAAIAKKYEALAKRSDYPKPMIHNYLITITGDDAVGMCSNELRITENGQSIIASGYYEDQYRRVNGRWRFAVREATFFHWVPIQQGWAKSTKPM